MLQLCVGLAAILLVLCLSLASVGMHLADARSSAPSAPAVPRGLPRIPLRRRRIGFRHAS